MLLLSSFCHLSNAEAALAHWCVLDSSLYPQAGQREYSQHYRERKYRYCESHRVEKCQRHIRAKSLVMLFNYIYDEVSDLVFSVVTLF